MLPVSGVITKGHWEVDTDQEEVTKRMETDIFLFTGTIV